MPPVAPIDLPIWSDLDKGYRAGLNDVGQGKRAAKAMLDELQTQTQQLLDETVKGRKDACRASAGRLADGGGSHSRCAGLGGQESRRAEGR